MAMMFTQLRSKFYFWHFFVALIIIRYIFLSIVNFSQYRYLSQAAVPSDIKAYLDQASWNDIRAVGLKYFKCAFWEDFITQAYFLVMIGFGLLPKAWYAFSEYAKEGLEAFVDPTDDFTRSIIFNGLYSVAHFLVITPLIKIWTFSEADLRVLPANLISILSGLAVEWTLLLIIRVTRKRKILAIGLISSLIIGCFGFLLVCGPDLMISSLERLPKIPQNAGVYSLLRKVGFPLDRVYQLDVFNGYTFGLGQNGIIVVGTQIIEAGIQGPLLEASVAHELGHWTYYHSFFPVVKFSVLGILAVFSFFYIVDRPNFYKSFGFHEYNKVPIGIGSILFGVLLVHISVFFAPLMNVINWQIEYQADSHSARLGYAKELTAVLVIFAKKHDIFWIPIMTTLFGLFHSTHPVFVDRVTALAKYID